MGWIRKAQRCSPALGCFESLLVVAGGAVALVWVVAIDGVSPTVGDLYRLLVMALPGH